MASLPAFLAVWTAMMALMMAPSAYPMVRLFAAVRQSRTAFGVRPAPVGAFVAGYLALWMAFGVPAYLLLPAWPMTGARRVVQAGALLVAGVYQLTPWKARCLGHCRAGSAFFLHTWRDGAAGAVMMGAHHGAYCVACCWGLMLVLLAFGAMSPVWMAAIAAVIFVEKVLPGGPRLGMALGAGAIVVALLRL